VAGLLWVVEGVRVDAISREGQRKKSLMTRLESLAFRGVGISLARRAFVGADLIGGAATPCLLQRIWQQIDLFGDLAFLDWPARFEICGVLKRSPAFP
jgi:hypothetical protein